MINDKTAKSQKCVASNQSVKTKTMMLLRVEWTANNSQEFTLKIKIWMFTTTKKKKENRKTTIWRFLKNVDL